MPEDWSTASSPIRIIFHFVRLKNPDGKGVVMANFQCLLESPFRWIARWSDYRAAGLVGAFFERSRGNKRTRRERMSRREYPNG